MVKVGNGPLTIEQIDEVVFKKEKVELDQNGLKKVVDSFNFLQEFSRDKVIYGINTSFGPMAQYVVQEDDRIQLQYNLIRSHCSGAGNPIDIIYVRSMMVARLNTLMQGYSGVHEEIVELLRDMINLEIYPVIFEHGGVGASGDLVQLAHLALALIGEGEASYKGEIRDIADVFKETDLKPIEIHIREGLAVMNGTSAMSGIGLVNLIHARNLLELAILGSAMINEVVESYDDHFSIGLNSVKKHKGQNHIARRMKSILSDSNLIKRRAEHLYDKKNEEDVLHDKVQEYYSLRCVPQVLGPVYETIENAVQILIDEINSANDNPIIDREKNNVFHGGNFHGDYVSFEMDKMKIAITKLSMLSERQLNYLFNNKLNNKLSPFINLGKIGFNFGMQGLQFTATSTVAENQTLSTPMYIHSIPNNNDNQDIVSMGTNAALMASKVIENAYQVLAIEFIGIVQAIDYLDVSQRLSKVSKSSFLEIRKQVPKFKNDQPKYKEISNLVEFLKSKNLGD